ncbi:hypothetical protein Q9Q99_02270 [Curtobacterium flaccumfaciens]|nr:hypothetical protein Q9Q99_02270 [Curtobacterium flaccumfaciens]
MRAAATKLVESLQSLSGFVQELRDAAKDEDDRRKQAKAWDARKREREENLLVAAGHEVSTWFGGGDDPKPPEPEPEPRLQAEEVSVKGREIPAGGGTSGGTSSAVPEDLRSFEANTRTLDSDLSSAVSTFRNALSDYEAECNPCWGTLNAQSLLTAVNDWLTAERAGRRLGGHRRRAVRSRRWWCRARDAVGRGDRGRPVRGGDRRRT